MYIERTQPLSAADRDYFQEAIFEGTWGERLPVPEARRMSAAARATLTRLERLLPGSRGLPPRPDADGLRGPRLAAVRARRDMMTTWIDAAAFDGLAQRLRRGVHRDGARLRCCAPWCGSAVEHRLRGARTPARDRLRHRRRRSAPRAPRVACWRRMRRGRCCAWRAQGRARRLRRAHPAFAVRRWKTRRRARRREVRRRVVELRRDQLRAATRCRSLADLAPLLEPGAPLAWVVMGRHVPWEWAWYLARGDPRKAFRRCAAAASRGAAYAFLIRRRASSRARCGRIFAPRVATPLGLRAAAELRLGLARSPAAPAGALTRVERAAQRWHVAAAFADHYIFEAPRSRPTMQRTLPLVTLYLTERCNSRCVTCDYWRHGRQGRDARVGAAAAAGRSRRCARAPRCCRAASRC